MHIYLYEANLHDKKFSSSLSKIETRITDLGLNGKIVRLSITQSVDISIQNELKNGAKTFIVVGSYLLLHQAINALAKVQLHNPVYKNVSLGYIPLGNVNKKLNSFFGINDITAACDALSARRIQKLDLGKINNTYFLSFCQITTKNTTLEIDKNYSIEIKQGGDVYVVNLPAGIIMPPKTKTGAKDKSLELFIQTKGKKHMPLLAAGQSLSVIPFTNLRIINNQIPVIVDQVVKIKSPVDIAVAEAKINLIVGKNRSF